MRPHHILLPLSLSLLRPSLASTTPFLGPLAPWEVRALSIDSWPSPTALSLTITNPNNITAGPAPHADGGGYVDFLASTAACTLEEGERNCTEVAPTLESYGAWTFAVRLPPGNNNSSSRRTFDIDFVLDYNLTRWGQQMYKVLEGTGHFAVDDAAAVAGGCADAGGCELIHLVEAGDPPVLIPPTITACRGTCEEVDE
ncbi:hypothetical protein F4780DRAFT_139958 [Xylariomycetidae sp. FL0641]|nr:hypothetical protein F4780DRAFT_139958 [Xylariomycetidae sp. FL0641]